jgi:hypothetical protein
LVYSAYAILSEKSRPKLAVTVFAISGFTRFGLLPKQIVSPARIFEERLVLGIIGIKVSILFERDSLARRNRPGSRAPLGRFSNGSYPRIVAPLGVGGNPDHLTVREAALSLWSRSHGCDLALYEDLPYAAKSMNLESEEASIVSTLEVERIHEECMPLSPFQMRNKLLLSTLYLTQTVKTGTLLQHARSVGSKIGQAYAERFFVLRHAKNQQA